MLPVIEILDQLTLTYRNTLQTNLVGVYLHGSLAMGCFNPNTSDIDFLVVVREKLSFDVMRELINILLQLSEDGPQKGFEMSIILESDAAYFRYPTPFLLHYSNYHRDRYLNQLDYICGGFDDPDLAAHIVITRERGICLYGKPIEQVFQSVPRKYYIQSIKNDVISSKADILDNPVYYILNLCRVLYYLREDTICSKKEGGDWAFSNLPPKYKDIIDSALITYKGTDKKLDWDSEILINFADFMLKEIGEGVDSED